MSKFLRMALLAALGVLTITTAASAVVPDPALSTCSLTSCYVLAPSGDSLITVTVKDQFGVAMNAASVVADFSGCAPAVYLCLSQEAGFIRTATTLTGTTNASGQLTIKIHGGGGCAGNFRVVASGVTLCSAQQVVSPDLNENGSIGLPDVVIFTRDQSSGNLAADLNCSGSVGLPDAVLLARWQSIHPTDPHCP